MHCHDMEAVSTIALDILENTFYRKSDVAIARQSLSWDRPYLRNSLLEWTGGRDRTDDLLIMKDSR